MRNIFVSLLLFFMVSVGVYAAKNLIADRIQFTELSATPTNSPATGKNFLYFKTDGNPYWLNDAGTESSLVPGNLTTVTKTTTYTATAADDVIYGDTSGGTWTLGLPAAADNDGKEYILTLSDATAGWIIDPNGSETIGGFTDIELNQTDETIVIVSDGTNWTVKNYYVNAHISASSSYTSASSSGAIITAMTGNSITLPVGVWVVNGSGLFNRSTGTSNATDFRTLWSESSSSAVSIGTGGNMTLEYGIENSSLRIGYNSTAQQDNYYAQAAQLKITSTASDVLYLDSIITAGTPSNFRSQVYIYARKIGFR